MKTKQSFLLFLIILSISLHSKSDACPLKRLANKCILSLHSDFLPERKLNLDILEGYKIKYEYIEEHCEKVKPFIVTILPAKFDYLNTNVIRNQVSSIANNQLNVTCTNLSFKISYPLVQDELDLLSSLEDSPYYECKGHIERSGVVKGKCTLLTGKLKIPIDEQFSFTITPASNTRVKINPRPLNQGTCTP